MPALPNMGIEPSMHPPVNIDHLYRDPREQDLDVHVLFTDATGHCKIVWTVGRTPQGTDVHRQLHIVREVGSDHLTNWGPYTVTAAPETVGAPQVFVARMTYAERRALEGVAARRQVMAPDGRWDCVAWVREVVEDAAKEGVVRPLDVGRVLDGIERYRLKR